MTIGTTGGAGISVQAANRKVVIPIITNATLL